jgi:hypothetical protein
VAAADGTSAVVSGSNGFASSSVHMAFVMDKVALGQVSLRGVRFTLSVSFHRGSPHSYII